MTKRVTMTIGAMAVVVGLCQTALASRPPTIWMPASPSNYTVGRQGTAINHVVIHVTEGGALSAVYWFQNPSAQASAHYVVAHSGTIYQCVADSNTAWHAGNWQYNLESIGIEHEGYTYQNTWTDAQYRASASLTRWICDTYGVPRDRRHIIGHNEVPDPDGDGSFGGAGNHTDPGPYFNWTYYMQLVGGGGGGGNPPPPPRPGLTAQQVTTGTLNVRTGPGTGNPIIGTIRNGQIYVADAASNGWHRIFYDRRSGWSYDGYLRRRVNGIGRRVTVSSLNVRTGPGTGYRIIGLCANPEAFVADTLQNNWLRIWYRGAQYWIYAGYTEIIRF